MNIIVVVLSSLGGILAFVGGCFIVVREVAHNVQATHDNTKALVSVQGTLEHVNEILDQHTVDIAVLKDRTRRNDTRAL